VLAALGIAFAILLVLAWALAPRGAPWANALTRLWPGLPGEAEWLAPAEVIGVVRLDYLNALAWLDQCASDWSALARDVESYTTGVFLKRQRMALGLLAQTRGPRLAAALKARHQVVVRAFSPDGLRCLVVDRQSERRMVTRRYWSGDSERVQRLPDTVLIWQMAYDLNARRWKIERLIQSLPAAPRTSVPVRLGSELPATAGRDH
jgi:hypothetical protein